MPNRVPTFRLLLALAAVALAAPASGEAPTPRQKAMAHLSKARAILSEPGDRRTLMSNFQRALHLVDQAVATDPDLGIAHMIRGQFAVQIQDWATAATHFEKATTLIGKSGQPLNPPDQPPAAKMTLAQLKGELHCSLGFVHVELGKRAHQQKRFDDEQTHLQTAHRHLKEGLTHSPSPQTRDYAEELLKAFAQVPTQASP